MVKSRTVPYSDCNEHMPLMIPITDVLERGFIPANGCSKKLKVKVSPGEFVFFGEPIPWWWPDMQ